MNEMNYRYNNPSVPIKVDTKLAECFAKKERTKEQVERFTLYASMSKEYPEMQQILQNVVVRQMEDMNSFKKVA